MGALPPPSPPMEQAGSGVEGPKSPKQKASGYEPPWPLSPINSESKIETTNDRRLSAANGGGYKITPTIPLPPPTPEPPTQSGVSPGPGAGAAIRGPTVQRVLDMDEKEEDKQKKSCACCIMM